MKKFWPAVAVIAVVAGIYFFENQKNPAPENSTATNETVSENNSSAPAAPGNSGTVPVALSIGAGANATSPSDLASRAASPNPTPSASEVQNLPPPTVLDKARVAIHNYNSAFGENPVGTNPEITAALMGKNPKQINFITPDSGLRVNQNGEMVDAYGTPFFFHQLSGQEMEIRSAGEDRKMWTFDDQVTR
jgi:hypothetical protein